MVRINLLPIRDILRTRELKQFGVTAGIIVVVTLVIAALVFFKLDRDIGELKADLRAYKQELKELEKKNEEINRLKGELARLRSLVKSIETLTQHRDTPAPFMRALSLSIPDEVWVTFISKAHNRFTLTGNGLDNTVVVKFVENLQRVRKNATLKRPWIDPRRKEDQPALGGVQLQQIVRAGNTGMMEFKISGFIY